MDVTRATVFRPVQPGNAPGPQADGSQANQIIIADHPQELFFVPLRQAAFDKHIRRFMLFGIGQGEVRQFLHFPGISPMQFLYF